MTPPGERNRRIVFQRAAPQTSGLGTEPPSAWTDYCIAWALVRFGTGKERREAAGQGASVTATFRVMSSSQTRAVTEADRIEFEGQAWDIASIATIGLNEEIEFTAVATKG